MKTATRHYCALAWKCGLSSQHTSGDGTPRRKRCAYCGGDFVIEHGWWGVFDWTAANRYPRQNALREFITEKAAQRHADTRNGDPSRPRAERNTVVRWIYP